MLKVHKALTARRDAALTGERRDGGFTLIELLIVVLIIGVLAAIAIPVYLSTVGTARDESAKATVNQAITALQAEFIAAGEYPADIGTTDFRAPNQSEIATSYTRVSTTEFCFTALAAGSDASSGFHATEDSGSPEEGTTC